MTEIVCIVCPKGCHLNVEETAGDYRVTGQGCERGEAYGCEEMRNPTRIITSTVKITGAAHRRCPVKTKYAIPKRLIPDAMRLLDNIELASPVMEGDIVVDNICGTGIPFVTTRSL